MSSSWMKKSCVFFLLMLLFSDLSYCQEKNGLDESATAADTLYEKPKIMKDRRGWELAAYLPGRIVYVPFKYTMKGINYSVGYIDESKIIPKIEDFLTSDDERRGIMPTYASQAGGGLKFYQKGLFVGGREKNILELGASAGEHSRQKYYVSLENLTLFGGIAALKMQTQYTKYTTESYYGIGHDSRESDETKFTQEQTSISFGIVSHPVKNGILGFVIGLDNTGIEEGMDPDVPSIMHKFDTNTIPGYAEGNKIFHAEGHFERFNLDRPGNPRRGYKTAFSSGFFQQTDGSDFGFTKYSADFSKYIHLFYERVMVLRFAAEINRQFEDQSIPFYYLSELGHKESIRGFERGRFRDRDKFLISAEYRYPVWRFWMERGLDIVLFADAGQVADDIFSDAGIDRLEPGFGVGARLWDQKGLVGKVEAGKSADGWRIYFVLN